MPCMVNCAPELRIKVKCEYMSVCTCVQHPGPEFSGCCAPAPGSYSPAAAWVSTPPSPAASPPSVGRPAPTDTLLSPAPSVRSPAALGLAPGLEIQPPGWRRGAPLPTPPHDHEKSPNCVPDVLCRPWESGWSTLTARSAKRGKEDDKGLFGADYIR